MECLKPWLNSDGTMKSDKEIKECSQKWDREKWEEYLNALEGGQKEILVDNQYIFNECSQEDHDACFRSFSDPKESSYLKRQLMEAMEDPYQKTEICLRKGLP